MGQSGEERRGQVAPPGRAALRRAGRRPLRRVRHRGPLALDARPGRRADVRGRCVGWPPALRRRRGAARVLAPPPAECFVIDEDARVYLTPGEDVLWTIPRWLHHVRLRSICPGRDRQTGNFITGLWVERTTHDSLPEVVESGSFCLGEEQQVGDPVAATRVHGLDGQQVPPQSRDENGQPIRFNYLPWWGAGRFALSGQVGCDTLKPQVSFRIRDGRVESGFGFDSACSVTAEMRAYEDVEVEEYQEPIEMWSHCLRAAAAQPRHRQHPDDAPAEAPDRRHRQRQRRRGGRLHQALGRRLLGLVRRGRRGAASCTSERHREPTPLEFTPPPAHGPDERVDAGEDHLRGRAAHGLRVPVLRASARASRSRAAPTRRLPITPAVDPWWRTTYGLDLVGGVDFGLYALGLVDVETDLFVVEDGIDAGGPLLGGVLGGAALRSAAGGIASARAGRPARRGRRPALGGRDRRHRSAERRRRDGRRRPARRQRARDRERGGGRALGPREARPLRRAPVGEAPCARQDAAPRARALRRHGRHGFEQRVPRAPRRRRQRALELRRQRGAPRGELRALLAARRGPDRAVGRRLRLRRGRHHGPEHDRGLERRLRLPRERRWQRPLVEDLRRGRRAVLPRRDGDARRRRRRRGRGAWPARGQPTLPALRQAGRGDRRRDLVARTPHAAYRARLNSRGGRAGRHALGRRRRVPHDPRTASALVAGIDADGSNPHHGLPFQDFTWESLFAFDTWVPDDEGDSADEFFDIAPMGDGFAIAGPHGASERARRGGSRGSARTSRPCGTASSTAPASTAWAALRRRRTGSSSPATAARCPSPTDRTPARTSSG
ncbi:MAG: hypothetical protein MZV64_72350 [Ignavibacteriales bacterium]|nr:hypothetical protein [Ignavibacteriales bacterium]